MIQAVKRDVVWNDRLYSIYDAKALLTPSAYAGAWPNLFDGEDAGGQLYLLCPQQPNTQEVVEALRGVGTWDEVCSTCGRIRGSVHAMGPKKLAEELNIWLAGNKRHRRGKRHKMRSPLLYDADEEVRHEATS